MQQGRTVTKLVQEIAESPDNVGRATQAVRNLRCPARSGYMQKMSKRRTGPKSAASQRWPATRKTLELYRALYELNQAF
jgi:hypothetical protein